MRPGLLLLSVLFACGAARESGPGPSPGPDAPTSPADPPSLAPTWREHVDGDGMVRVRVRDLAGSAIPAASVCVAPEAVPHALECGFTDEAGEAALSARTGDWRLHVAHPDLLAATWPAPNDAPLAWPAKGGALELRLAREGMELQGRVTDVRGSALPRAYVVVQRANDILAVAAVDSSGRFGVRVPSGRMTSLFAYAPGHARRVVYPYPPDAALHLALIAESTIKGRVVDGEGRPLAGAWVVSHAPLAYVERQRPRARTNEAGDFVLGGLTPGRYSLHVSAANARRVEPVVVALPYAATVELEPIATEPGHALALRLVDPSGRPCVDGFAKFEGPGGLCLSRADGWCSFGAVPPGDRAITASCPASLQIRRTIAVQGDVRETWTFERGGSLTGVVLDDTNAPVADAEVRAPDEDLQTTTDAHGRFVLAGLSGRRVDIQVVSLDHHDERRSVEAGADVQLVLRRRPAVAFHVSDRSGRPARGVALRWDHSTVLLDHEGRGSTANFVATAPAHTLAVHSAHGPTPYIDGGKSTLHGESRWRPGDPQPIEVVVGPPIASSAGVCARLTAGRRPTSSCSRPPRPARPARARARCSTTPRR
ncbi:carboxypeptidase-like regulatory domain-containing protein [Nannocystis sp. RBIL2]|uniref:carboxypeptidase-like regulatory domain-containing protein n=1 Tax=Nannocystis sp. RBIL2 TaxID=2996788 RepID=UPI00227105D0|nr:carboxypeptidase-like regulatory domain-containing protein [Nannocystis sp. RBIL2]MCY1070539.1 carboxypeptidase-like regulatory domain-containing protein [Nannocystis sp. RBIL2]